MTDNIDIFMKLFDTLKQASDKHESTLQKLIEQQQKLVGHIEYLPIKDLQTALDNHGKESTDEISTCTETVTITSSALIEKIRTMDSKISKMIIVVIVAFTVLTGGYFIIRGVTDYSDDAVLKTHLEEIEAEQEKRFMDAINSIKDAMDEHHKDDGEDLKELKKIMEDYHKKP